MKILQYIYDLYLQSVNRKEGQEEMDVSVASRESDIVHKIRNESNKKLSLINKDEFKVGDIFLLNDLSFVLTDITTYPFEVLMVSPFWELATHKDIIVDTDESRWALESIIRYVDEEMLANAIKLDRIDEKYIEVIKDYLDDRGELPIKLRGLEYEDGDNSPQELFRKNEIKRSLILTIKSIEDLDKDVDDVIEIDLINSNVEKSALSKIDKQLAAASFDKFIVTKFGEIIRKKDGIIINLEEKFIGCLSRISINGEIIFEGFLPKKLKIKTQIKYPKQLEEIMNIELL